MLNNILGLAQSMLTLVALIVAFVVAAMFISEVFKRLGAVMPYVGARALKRIDDVIFRCEVSLVTLAALIMTCTVGLDIFSRLLRGQKSAEFVSTMNVFGLIEYDASGLISSYTPVIALLIAPLLLGASAYSARRQNSAQDSAQELAPTVGLKSALMHGLLWSLGALALSIFVYQASSSTVCLVLSLGGGVGLLCVRVGSPLLVIILSALLIWGSHHLPQGYIWSQELSLILLAWVAFLGASMATHEYKHIKVSAFAKLIPEAYRARAEATGLIITGLFAGYLTISLFGSVFGPMGSYHSGEVRPSTGIPAWVILFSGVVSFAMITARSFAYGARALSPHSARPKASVKIRVKKSKKSKRGKKVKKGKKGGKGLKQRPTRRLKR